MHSHGYSLNASALVRRQPSMDVLCAPRESTLRLALFKTMGFMYQKPGRETREGLSVDLCL